MDKSKGEEWILEKRAKRTEYMRQKRAKMSDEERQKVCEKRRLQRAKLSDEKRKEESERQRLKRSQRSEELRQLESDKLRLKRLLMSDEEREKVRNYRARKTELDREYRQRRSQILRDKDSEAAKRLRERELAKRQKQRERKKKELHDMKLKHPDQYREYLDNTRFQKWAKKAAMTEEEKEEERNKRWLYRQARNAALTPEEIEERRKKSVVSSIRSQKKRWEEATAEEKDMLRISRGINQRKGKLRKNLFKEGLSLAEVKRRADEQEEIWWREVYPDGKPPRRTSAVQPIWDSSSVKSGNESGQMEVFDYICVKCHPLWMEGPRRFQPVGFNRKTDLLEHVMEKHPTSYFPCSNCNLLKYAKKALDTHLNYCLNKETSAS